MKKSDLADQIATWLTDGFKFQDQEAKKKLGQSLWLRLDGEYKDYEMSACI
jgi:hypothetical protein